MIHPDTFKRSSILSKRLSDFIGRATGEEYFSSLVNAVCQYLAFDYGSVFILDNGRLDHRSVIAESASLPSDYDPLAMIDLLILNQMAERNDHFLLIDLDRDYYGFDCHESLALQTILLFPLYDTGKALNGVIVFSSHKFLSDQELIIDSIEGQIPRAESELDRLQLQKRLDMFESSYSNLLDSTQDVIWEADTDGCITAINEACKAVYGYAENRMIGKEYTRFMTDESAADFKDYLGVLRQGEPVYNVISDHFTRNLEVIKVCYNIIPKFDEQSRVIGVIGSSRDISASVQAQRTIKNNSELFSSILSRLPVIFFRVDEKGFLVDIRGNGLKRMGVEDMDWVGRPGYGLFIGMDAKIDSALSGNTVFFENKGTYQGTPWWFYTSMFFDSWAGYGAVGFSVDITQQKYVEQQLVELLNSNRKLAQRLVAVQEDERRNLARELHDELGQSITAVKSLATVINASANGADDEISSLAGSIIDLSGRLYEVVNSIMQRLRPDIIDGLDFNEAIRNCIVRSQLETVGVNCSLDIVGNINNLDEVIKVSIYRIVQECLTNISKHAMASNVSVRIRRSADNPKQPVSDSDEQQQNTSVQISADDAIRIEISDDGIGMDVEKPVDGNAADKRHGLQGMRERITAMGGTFNITSGRGKGVKVEVMIGLDDVNRGISADISKCVTELNRMRSDENDIKAVTAL